jgi:plasmid stabilization system protein ParE
MKYRLVISKKFDLSFRETVAILKKESSPANTSDFIDEVKEKVSLLSDFPYMGAFFESKYVASLNFRYLTIGKFMVIYKVNQLAKSVVLSSFTRASVSYFVHL